MNKRLKINQLLPFVFKQPCLLCGAKAINHQSVCADCRDELPWHDQSSCSQCALPLAEDFQGSVCGQCLTAQPNFDHTRALFSYAFPVDAVLQAFKYQQQLTIAHFFAQLCIQKWPRMPKYDYVIPMPIHPARLQTRGFNQSLEIARLLCKTWALPLDYQHCIRVKNTPPQTSLALKERQNNVKGAFQCNLNLSKARVLVVDDVMTTGASLNAVAKTLKQSGAITVDCLVMARTKPYQNAKR